MYPLGHDHHPLSNRVTPNGVGLLPESQTRIASGCNPPSQSRLRRASSPKGRAKGRALPAQRMEIFAAVI